MKSRYLPKDIPDACRKIEELEKSLKHISSAYGALEEAYGNLAAENKVLASAYEKVEEEKQALSSAYEKVEEEKQALSSAYEKVEEEKQALSSAYEKVEEEKQALSSAYEKVEEEKRELAIKLSLAEEQLNILRAKFFGPSSEKNILPPPSPEDSAKMFNEPEACFDPSVPEPDREAVISGVEAAEKARTRKKPPRGNKKKGKRDFDFQNLIKRTVVIEPPEEEKYCPHCREKGENFGIGEPGKTRVEYIPAHYELVTYVQAKYVCKNPQCDHGGETIKIIAGAMPDSLIPNSGIASASLVAKIIDEKYGLALPLYRQEKQMKYFGVPISRQTMANWMITVAIDYIFPIWVLLQDELFTGQVIMMDETTIQVLQEPGRVPEAQSRMFVLRTSSTAPRHVVLFLYEKSRCVETLETILEEFSTGYLQSDGLNIYHNVPNILNVGCWQHAKRPFTDFLKTLREEERKKSVAAEGVELINKLFKLERDYKGMTAEERYEARLLNSKPIAEKFFSWAGNCKVLPQSQVGKGIAYVLNQKEYLMNVFLDGRLELSNNLTESAIRPFVTGRKNWLFSNTPRGADASAILYSMLETAKANGLIPFYYFRYILERVSSSSFTTSMFAELLPWSSSIPEECQFKKCFNYDRTLSLPSMEDTS